MRTTHHRQAAHTYKEQIARFTSRHRKSKDKERSYYGDVLRYHRHLLTRHEHHLSRRQEKRNISLAVFTLLLIIAGLSIINSLNYTGHAVDQAVLSIPDNEQLSDQEIRALILSDIGDPLATSSTANLTDQEIHDAVLAGEIIEDFTIEAYEYLFTPEELALIKGELTFQDPFTTQAFTACSFTCDTGSMDSSQAPECNVTSIKSITTDGCTINGTANLIVRSGGAINSLDAGSVNTKRVSFIINTTGNVTIESGAIVNLSGADNTDTKKSVFTVSQHGGDLIIASNALTMQGQILAKGGKTACKSEQYYGGEGGDITIKTYESDLKGNISTEGGDICSFPDYDYFNSGNHAGHILINSTLLTNNASLAAQGGDGGLRCEGQGGVRGKGGTIRIEATNLSMDGEGLATQGVIGGQGKCLKPNRNGNATVWYTGAITIGTPDYLPLWQLKPDSYECNTNDGTGDKCLEGAGCDIRYFHCYLSGNKLYTNLNITKGFIDTHSSSLNLTITDTFKTQGTGRYLPVEGEQFNLHHAGTGSLNLSASRAYINGTISNLTSIYAITNLSIGSMGHLWGFELLESTTLDLQGNISVTQPDKVIQAQNISIGNGGLIYSEDAGDPSSTRQPYTINTTNLRISAGGKISGDGAQLYKDGDYAIAQQGATLTLIADQMNIQGTITSQGGNSTPEIPQIIYRWQAGGKGGRLDIQAGLLNITGELIVDGGHDANWNSDGGHAGIIAINASTIDMQTAAQLNARGGKGQDNACDQRSGGKEEGHRGHGGIINITAGTIILNGAADARRSDEGYCDDGDDGIIVMAYNQSMSWSGQNAQPPFFIQDKLCNMPLFDNCLEQGQCAITDISCELTGLKNYQNMTLTYAQVHTPNASLTLNITDTFTITSSQYLTPKGAKPTYKHGTGTLTINTRDARVENVLYNPYLLNYTGTLDLAGSSATIRIASNNSLITGPNLTIANDTSIDVDGAQSQNGAPSYTLRAQDTLRIEQSGRVESAGEEPRSDSLTAQSSGDIHLTARTAHIRGTLSSRGVDPRCNQDYQFQTGGSAGTISVDMITLSLTGAVNSSGGGVCPQDTSLRHNGGPAGTIRLNASAMALTGALHAKGGLARDDQCHTSDYGHRGNGGLINITGENLTMNADLNARRADTGYCDDGRDGEIQIAYTGWLRRAGSTITPLFWLKPDGHQCNLDNGTSDTCLAQGTCTIDRYRCTLSAQKNYQHVIIDQGFIDLPDTSLTLNVTQDLNITPINETYKGIASEGIQHNGTGTARINATNVNIFAGGSIRNIDQLYATSIDVWGSLIPGQNTNTITANNLSVHSGGSVRALSEDIDETSAKDARAPRFTIETLDTLLVHHGGLISGTGRYRDNKPSSTGQQGSNFTITATNFILNGNLTSNGGNTTCAIAQTAGKAGEIRVLGGQLFVNQSASIALDGGEGCAYNSNNGGDAGRLLVNVSTFTLQGDVTSKGGTGQSTCGESGRTDLIADDLTITGSVDTQGAGCGGSQDGTTLTEYRDTLNITTATFTPQTELLKQTGNGSIRFQDGINNTGITELDPLHITFNNFTINTPLNPGLNTTTTMLVRGIPSDLLSVVVLQNGKECLAPECQIVQYNKTGQFAIFNVTHWTSYSIQGGGTLSIDAPTPFNRREENITIWADYEDLGSDVLGAEVLLNLTTPTGAQDLSQVQMYYNSSTSRYEYVYAVKELGLYNYSVFANKTNHIARTESKTFFSGVIDLNFTIQPNVTRNSSLPILISGSLTWDNGSLLPGTSIDIWRNYSTLLGTVVTNASSQFNFTYVPSLQGRYPLLLNATDSPLASKDNKSITVDYIIPEIRYPDIMPENDSHLSQDYISVWTNVTEEHEFNITYRIYNATGLQERRIFDNRTRLVVWENLTTDGPPYLVNVTVTDFAGNVNSTETRSLRLDTITPELAYTAQTAPNGSHHSRDYVFINVTASDLFEANITFELYTVTGNVTTLTNRTRSPNAQRWVNYTNLDPNRDYLYNVSITDKAGNVNSTETRSITLDITPPAVAFSADVLPSGLLLDNKSDIYVNVSVFDTNEANITFWLYNSTAFYNYSIYYTQRRNHTFLVYPDAFYLYNVTVSDHAGNRNTTSTRDIDLDDFAPVINVTFPVNNSAYTSSILNRSLNWTIDEKHPDQCWHLVINNTRGSPSQTDNNIRYVNCTQLTDNINVTRGPQNVTFWANDTLGHLTRYFHEFLMNTKPTIPVLSYPPNNSHKIYNNLSFNVLPSTDEDNDPLKYNYVFAKDQNFTNIVRNITTNIGETNYTSITLPDGDIWWEVAAVDPVESSNYSPPWKVDNIQARIGITVPVNLTIFVPGGDKQFIATELNRTDWINDVDLQVLFDDVNSTYDMVYAGTPANQFWTYTYTPPLSLTPRLLRATVIARNNTQENVNFTYTYRVTKLDAPAPSVDYLCSFPTYSPIGSQAVVLSNTSLNTLLQNLSVEVNWSNSSTQQLYYISPVSNNLTYRVEQNFTTSSNYTINVSVTDINGQTSHLLKHFYSTPAHNLSIRSNGTTSFYDLCTGRLLASGQPVNISLAQGYYNALAYTPAPWLTLSDVYLDNTSTHLFNYTELGTNFPKPEKRTILQVFDLASVNIGFTNATLYFNYTDYLGGIGNESLLELWKCKDTNCTNWTQYPSDVNLASNILSSQLNGSLFDLRDNMTVARWGLIQRTVTEVNETEVEGPSGGEQASGGGGGTRTRRRTVYRNVTEVRTAEMELQLLSPLSLRINSSAIGVVRVTNTGQVNLTTVVFGADSDSGLRTRLSRVSEPLLVVGESTFVTLNVTSVGEPGTHEVTVAARSTSPEHRSVLTILIDVETEKEIRVVQVLNLTEATFAANPACLDLQELADKAQRALNEGKLDEAEQLARAAIEACQELAAQANEPFTQLPRVIKADVRTGYLLIGLGAFISSFVLLYTLSRLKVHKKHNRHFERQF